MNSAAFIPAALAVLWAGVALGGSLIAAPAKFQAPSLSMPSALEVGRAQFLWVGIGEALVCGLLIAALVFIPAPGSGLFVIPIILFALQRLAVMPVLDARSLRVIEGGTAGPRSLHRVYILLEVAKFLMLLGAAARSFANILNGAGG